MNKNYLTIEKISAYRKSFDFSNKVWNMVTGWDFFAKDTIGKQLVRAADSISANLAEGFGRFYKKEKVRFYKISLGSMEETGDWIRKAHRRDLISSEINSEYANIIMDIRLEINHLIKFTDEKLKL